MKAYEILKLLLTLLPMIADAVKAVELLLPESGKGKEKLALVRELIDAAVLASTEINTSVRDIWPAVEKAIGGIVAAFNATGVFKK